MIRSVASLICAASLVSTSAFATGNGGGQQQMTLDDLKAKCKELQADEQLKPFKAVVSCKKETTEWRPSRGASSSVQVPNKGTIGAQFTLKGFQVPFQSEPVNVPSQEVGCTVMQQVQLTVPAVDLELSCEALAEVSSIADLCNPVIDARVEADPSIVQEQSTGKEFDSCSGKGQQSQASQSN